MRPYRGDTDYWAIRGLLSKIFALNGNGRDAPRGCHVAKFDYWYCHVNQNITCLPLERSVFVWETPHKRVVAAVHPEVVGEASLQIDPHWRTLHLEHEMLEVAEQFLAIPALQGHRRLRVWVDRQDQLRRECLVQRNYRPLDGELCHWERSMSGPLPECPVPAGYQLRLLTGEHELPERAFVSWKAFHPDVSDEYYQASNQNWQWYRNVQESPLYCPDLDLVVVDTGDTIVGFGTIWYDPLTRSGLFEPVGVHPVHQRQGLGQAIMAEGLERLQNVGARVTCLSSYSAHVAHHLYEKVGFTVEGRMVRWERVLG